MHSEENVSWWEISTYLYHSCSSSMENQWASATIRCCKKSKTGNCGHTHAIRRVALCHSCYTPVRIIIKILKNIDHEAAFWYCKLCKWGSHTKAEGEAESNSREAFKIDAEIQWRKGPCGGEKIMLILSGFIQILCIFAAWQKICCYNYAGEA